MGNRREDYKKFLKSREWSGLRDVALVRTDGLCQFCGDFAVAVHHVRYPKKFGEEHPNSTVPVCKRCHDTAHGVIKVSNELTKAERFQELSPTGGTLKYLLSEEGRIYASAKSWSRALMVPDFMAVYFETGLARWAILKKDVTSGPLEMVYQGIQVYRWHAVAAQLRTFDREFNNSGYQSRAPAERKQLERFHENYERLTNWGYDLQERAIAAMVNAKTEAPVTSSSVSQDALIEAIRQAVAPRLHAHDGKLMEHDAIIAEIKEAVPTLRDANEFIPVRQAIQEKGLDPTVMPLHPRSRENLSGLAGQLLKSRGAQQGGTVVSRLDGGAITTPMNKYRRGEIYTVLDEIMSNEQGTLPL